MLVFIIEGSVNQSVNVYGRRPYCRITSFWTVALNISSGELDTNIGPFDDKYVVGKPWRDVAKYF